ncbi:MAG: hypothetical protein KBA66_07660 [Leptospiraceae bacterium]|nr:hypothetical protein [Leptospiraceae bacterium]
MKSLLYVILFSLTTNLLWSDPVPDYKISDIKIIPFESKTGEFQEQVKQNQPEPYSNAISTSFFVIVEISGKAGSYESKRKVEIQVLEGGRKKVNKVETNMLLGANGKFFIPLLLSPLICKDLKITANVLGQTKESSLTRTIPFRCGE